MPLESPIASALPIKDIPTVLVSDDLIQPRTIPSIATFTPGTANTGGRRLGAVIEIAKHVGHRVWLARGACCRARRRQP
jgi:hypothetical protein